MKRFIHILCLNVLALATTFAGTISIQPSATTLPLGSPLSLDVNVSGISDLYAWQFDIAFNPAVLSANNVTEGALFSSVGVFFSPGTIDNTAGTITFIGDSLSGPGPGISTDGTLAQIVFTAIGPGSSVIDLSNVILLDSNLNDITASAVSGSVTVVPEPSYLTVLGASFIVLLARLRRSPR
ncbi:MAG: cohesin domain-containing protein [Bryobacteraceae bacterium]